MMSDFLPPDFWMLSFGKLVAVVLGSQMPAGAPISRIQDTELPVLHQDCCDFLHPSHWNPQVQTWSFQL